MNTKKFRQILLVVAAGILASVPIIGFTLDDYSADFQMSGGFQEIYLKGDQLGNRTSKFDEYRILPNEYVVNDFSMKLFSMKNPHYYEIFARDPLQKDQTIRTRFEQPGLWRSKSYYNETPHLYSRDAVHLLTDQGGGVFTIDPWVKTTLENSQVNVRYNPTQVAQVLALMDADGRKEDVGILRRQGGTDLKVYFSDIVNFTAGFDYLRRDGNRPFSVGAYVRNQNQLAGQPAQFNYADTFNIRGIELPATIKDETTKARAGIEFHKNNWAGDAGYEYTRYDNNITTVTWDNPFRITDTSTATVGAGQRGRFARDQKALSPDNTTHSGRGALYVDLPSSFDFNGNIDFKTWEQNDPFLPYTLNTATLAIAQAQAQTLDGRTSLNGKMNDLSQFYQLLWTSKRNDKIKVSYRGEDLQNKTAGLTFPGRVRYSGSRWVDNFENDSATPDFSSATKHVVKVDAKWRINPQFTLDGNYEKEIIDRKQNTAKSNDQDKAGGRLSYRSPDKKIKARGSFEWSKRDVTYNAAAFQTQYGVADTLPNRSKKRYSSDQFPLTKDYDVSDRSTYSYGIDGSYDAQAWFLEAGYTKNFEDYNASWGLRDNDDNNVYANLDVMFGPASIQLGYTRNWSEANYGFVTKDTTQNAQPSLTNWNTANNGWARKNREYVNDYSVSVAAPIWNNRIDANVGYTLSDATLKYSTQNEGTPNALRAVAAAWSDVETKKHEATVGLRYPFSRDLALTIDYTYERFILNDFTKDLVRPYVPDESNANPHSVDDFSNYIYMDATYSDYESHAASMGLDYRF